MARRKVRKKKRKIKYFRIFIALLILLGGIFGVLNLPIFSVKEIAVTGNSKVPTETIVELSDIDGNDNIIFLRKNKIEENILKNPFIESVKVSRGFLRKVNIIVNERTAASTVQIPNKYILIDRFGVIVGESDTLMLNLLLLRGIDPKDEFRLGENIFNYATSNQNKLLEKIYDGETLNRFKSITLEDDKSELILDNDIVVAFGSYNNVEYKLNVLEQMINTLEANHGKNAVMILMEEGPNPILVYE